MDLAPSEFQDSTWKDVREAAKQLMIVAGHYTFNERESMGEENPKMSVNECLGMAIRALAVETNDLQAIADDEELKNV